MSVRRGQIWWVEFGVPRGSGAGYRRPALVVQSNAFNESRIATVMVAPLTSNLRLGDAPGNVLVTRRRSGLARDSVVNVSLTSAVDRDRLVEHFGVLDDTVMQQVDRGLRELLSL